MTRQNGGKYGTFGLRAKSGRWRAALRTTMSRSCGDRPDSYLQGPPETSDATEAAADTRAMALILTPRPFRASVDYIMGNFWGRLDCGGCIEPIGRTSRLALLVMTLWKKQIIPRLRRGITGIYALILAPPARSHIVDHRVECCGDLFG